MTTLEIIQYYANLLVLQYLGSSSNQAFIETIVTGSVMDQLPNQVMNGFNLNPTIQTLTFSAVAASGSFVITYNGNNTVPINWNDPLQTIQNDINMLLGVNSATVLGTIASQSLVITFNTIPVPGIVMITSNSLEDVSTNPIAVVVTNNIAQGVQLDILGKYVGVTRSGFGTSGPVVLTDLEFLQLIYLGIADNSDGSSLAQIQSLLHTYFPGQIYVFDYANTEPMTMSYLINTDMVNENVLQLAIVQNLLPKPMGVGLSIVSASTITTFFGMCDYASATPTMPNTVNSTPMNCSTSYTSGDYIQTWPFLDYNEAIIA